MVGEMIARNDLIGLNQGKEFTVRRGAGRSIIDLTIAAPRLASRIGDPSVLKDTPLSELVGSSLLGRWRTLCARRRKRLSQLATTRCPAVSAGKPRARCTGGMTSWLPYVVNASQRGGDFPVKG